MAYQSRIASIDECADARLIDRAAKRVPDVRGDNADEVFRQIRFENLFVRFNRGICAAINNQIQNVAAEVRAADVLGVENIRIIQAALVAAIDDCVIDLGHTVAHLLRDVCDEMSPHLRAHEQINGIAAVLHQLATHGANVVIRRCIRAAPCLRFIDLRILAAVCRRARSLVIEILNIDGNVVGRCRRARLVLQCKRVFLQKH